MTTVTDLPVPQRERWQPLRAGLVDLFYYDYQEFWFCDGRLLLRGNNGTGKSKVLALTLPFLLDADLSPARVEPDGDRDKKMEWNLLLGGKYDERLGYAWLELGRRTEDGEHAYLAIGCGLKAVAGRGIADRWYFFTSQRVGLDLFLIGSGGAALTRDRLTAAVGDYGQVTQKAEQYRSGIDEHLFHLGADRYAGLVDLLVQLRQPQLSKRPNEERLSGALSAALTPLDQSVLADIAAAFHDLQQQRHAVTAMRETRGHLAKFLQRYRHYAQVAARRQARQLRSGQAAYEQVGRNLGAVREEIGRARTAEEESAGRLREITGELVALRAAREELAGRPELTSLEHAERHAGATARDAARGAEDARKTVAKHSARQARLGAVVEAAQQTRALVVQSAVEAAGRAAEAGLGSGHDALVAPLALPDGASEPQVQAAEQEAERLVQSRTDAAIHVLGLAEEAERKEDDARSARRLLGEREGERDAAADATEQADAAVEEAARRLVESWRSYAAEATELRLPHPDETGFADWALTLDGPNPAEVALHAAAGAAQESLAAARVTAEAREKELREVLGGLEEERWRLEAGETTRPPAPYIRAEGVRDGRAGAPLWQVTEFVPGLDEETKAGLEAALEASGLLDAWITPDGRLLDPGMHDVVVTAEAPVIRGLREVLLTAVDSADPQAPAVSPDTIAAVLAGIGLGPTVDARAWVDVNGSWQIGPLHGSWSKPATEYVGAGAREEARRRRLVALTAEIAEAEQRVGAAHAALEAIRARQATLAAELQRQPSDQPLRDAHGVVAGARKDLERASARVEAQRKVVEGAAATAAQAAGQRDMAAADLRLPTATAELRAVLAAATAYAGAIQELAGILRRHADKLADVATWTEELRQATEELSAAETRAREAAEEAREAASRLATLREAIGATAEELRHRLAETKRRIGALEGEHKRLDTGHRGIAERRARLQGREEQLQTDLGKEAERRDAAVFAFQRFTATGLLAVAAPNLEVPAVHQLWAADPAVRLARRAEQALTEVDDGEDAWKRIQDEIGRRYTELAEALTRHGHHAQMSQEAERFVVTIQFQGRERPPGELAALLDDEVGYRERMLTAKERELIEEHLVNDVASQLQELISDAEAQVERMNAELAERPTSTGMRLRLRWQPSPDGPAGLPEARRRLLRQDAELWSPEDRAAVGDFLQRQIEAERARDDTGTWQEHLRRALDYRGWHRFVIERFQDGRWRPATGPASTGERVLTVSLPLFAAASAHYRSAHPHAPRLVMLDEAFAGVDDDARAKCLGLLATFDLDVVMTSEREWGFYATVPGIATHQLVRRDGIDAVHVTVWEWDGRTPQRVERAFRARPEPAAEGAELW